MNNRSVYKYMTVVSDEANKAEKQKTKGIDEVDDNDNWFGGQKMWNDSRL